MSLLIRRKTSRQKVVPGCGVLGVSTPGATDYLRLEDGSRLYRVEMRDRTLYRRGAPRGWKHPWTVEPYYFPGLSSEADGKESICQPAGWYARIQPGTVNGLDPLVPGAKPIPVPEAPSTPDAAYTIGRLDKAPPGQRAAGLLDGPMVPLLSFRRFRQTRGQVAEFFKQYGFDALKAGNLGDGTDIQISTDLASGLPTSLTMDVTNQASNPPWLGVIDIFVSTARAGYKLTTEIGAFPLTAIEYKVQYDDTALGLYGTRARINTGEIPQKNYFVEIMAARQAGQAIEDDGLDHLKLASVYVLKANWQAKNKNPDAVTLDGQEEVAFVQHHCFWNLDHQAGNRSPYNIPSGNWYTTLTPLIGRYTMAPIFTLAAAESKMNEVLAAALNAGSNEGRYWSV